MIFEIHEPYNLLTAMTVIKHEDNSLQCEERGCWANFGRKNVKNFGIIINSVYPKDFKDPKIFDFTLNSLTIDFDLLSKWVNFLNNCYCRIKCYDFKNKKEALTSLEEIDPKNHELFQHVLLTKKDGIFSKSGDEERIIYIGFETRYKSNFEEKRLHNVLQSTLLRYALFPTGKNLCYDIYKEKIIDCINLKKKYPKLKSIKCLQLGFLKNGKFTGCNSNDIMYFSCSYDVKYPIINKNEYDKIKENNEKGIFQNFGNMSIVNKIILQEISDLKNKINKGGTSVNRFLFYTELDNSYIKLSDKSSLIFLEIINLLQKNQIIKAKKLLETNK